MSPEDLVILALLVLVIPAAVMYPIFYAFRPWWSTPQGRALMVMAFSTGLLLSMGLVYIVFGEYPGRTQVRIVAFSLMVIGINYLFATLLTSPGAEDYPPRSWLRRFRRRDRPPTEET